MGIDPVAIADAIWGVVGGEGQGPVSLHEPHLAGAEWQYVKDCLDTGWVSSVGAYVDRFEADLATQCGVERAVAVVNGTAALQIALLVSGVSPGDEVLMPTLSFVATANAASHGGAIPHFVDSSQETLGLCPCALETRLRDVGEVRGGRCFNRETGRRIAAIVPAHILGIPADMDGLRRVADAWGLPLVADAAEAIGSYYHGAPVCGAANLSVLSFNGNKTITTGGGGAILCKDAAVAQRAKHLTTTAKLPHRWRFDHDQIGYNYRLPNINAALGCAQLEQLPHFLDVKRRLARRYRTAFAGVPGVRVVTDPEGCESNHWLNAIQLNVPGEKDLEALLEYLNDRGIQARPAWTPLHRLSMYAECPRGELAQAEALARSLVCLPSGVAVAERGDRLPA